MVVNKFCSSILILCPFYFVLPFWFFIHFSFHPSIFFIHYYVSSIFFIHYYVSFIIIIHPCTHGKIFLHIMIYFMPFVKEYFSNILLMLIKYSKKIRFCSCAHAHLLTFMLPCSPFNIPPYKLPSNYTKK